MTTLKVGDEVILTGKIIDKVEAFGEPWLVELSSGHLWIPEKHLQLASKVVIPQFVADWIEEKRSVISNVYTAFALLGQRKNDVSLWVNANLDDFARVWLDGYEVEQEQLYEIPLKGLMTTDGKQQYLTGRFGRYFASRKHTELKQTFTQSELENNVPKEYRQFAVKVED